MKHIIKITGITQVTHDVRCLRLQKPAGYSFVPGQATEVAINKPGWEHEMRPFTFTGLNSDPYLELTIKCYTDHDGVTNQVGQLKEGDELIIDEPWGAIEYKGDGCFIAGGAGITPFIAILRQLHADGKINNNQLLFSNKTPDDIIYEDELKRILGNKAAFVLTDTAGKGYERSFIDEAFITEHIDNFTKHFYVCGPDPMIKSINDILIKKGAKPDAVIFEK